MRIGVSGTHFSGKSTLIASLLKQFSNYTSVDEPYFLLEEDGYEFSDPPTVEDFEKQLMYSIKVIKGSQDNTLFDRCPLDCLAYALAIDETRVDIEEWIEKLEDAIQLLDLIVYIPIETRIPVRSSENLKLRKYVDEKLQDMILNDSLGILKNIEVLEVVGSIEKRASMVKDMLKKDLS